MFKTMNLAVGALALALCLGSGAGAYAQDQQNNPPTTPGASSPSTSQDQQNNPTATPGASNPSGAQSMQNGSDTGRRGRRRRSRDEGMTGSEMTGTTGTTATMAPMGIDWSRRYVLTPLDQKRLQAMGLTKEEAWATAKAAHESNEDVDTVAQMVLRGRSFWQIADELNIPYDSLFRWPERWQSAEWAEAVKEGSPVWYAHSTTTGMTSGTGNMNSGGTR